MWKNSKTSKTTSKNGNGVISPSCGLLWILSLKMWRSCIFTTVGISKNKIMNQVEIKYGSEIFGVFCGDV